MKRIIADEFYAPGAGVIAIAGAAFVIVCAVLAVVLIWGPK